MEYITPQLFYWVVGLLIGINSAVIGYWIRVISGVGKDLTDHKESDEKEFQKSTRENDEVHSKLRLEIAQAEGRNNTKVTEIVGKLDLANEKIDNLTKLLERHAK